MGTFHHVALCLALAVPQALCAQSLTFFVDGIDPGVTFDTQIFSGPIPARQSSYLANSPLGQTLLASGARERDVVYWNGDLNDTTSIVRSVAQLELKLLKAARAGKSIDIVSHSMGTVIAYLALADLAIKTTAISDSPYKGVNNFVTLASPLAFGFHRNIIRKLGDNSELAIPSSEQRTRTPTELLVRGRWINAFAEYDPLGGQIDVEGVENLPIVKVTLPHSLPYRDHQTATTIQQALSAEGRYFGDATASGTTAPCTASNREGLDGREIARALGATRNVAREQAIGGLVRSGKLAQPICAHEAALVVAGTTGASRSAAIKHLVSILQSDLSGEQARSILGSPDELAGVARQQAISVLAKARKLKRNLSGAEIEMLLEGTSGESRKTAIQALAEM